MGGLQALFGRTASYHNHYQPSLVLKLVTYFNSCMLSWKDRKIMDIIIALLKSCTAGRGMHYGKECNVKLCMTSGGCFLMGGSMVHGGTQVLSIGWHTCIIYN